ncbi:translation initiation factor IF-2 [Sulfurospirillum multivorans]|uniref:Translation initiation factor IF-2 n=2 Tax=Sulfurospirillum multivorans TaxID=66821 RepID=A0AA86AJJ8_SULMK|nr:translation initiation factor IF-2 [Sulfurospirillum multivorans]AHJ11609.1 translation initiation factor 2 [Sulfurospirillum multivorans DSM 12446]QEH05109.1 translation initiation factor 2 [Sulfurospirillum multivorans]
MDKVRITEIAKELGMKNKEIVDKAVDLGLDVKGHSSSISTEDAEKLMNYVLSGETAQASKPSPQPKAPEIKHVEVVETPAPVVEKPKVPEVAAPKTKTLKEKELETGHTAQTIPQKEVVENAVSDVVADKVETVDKVDPTNVQKRRGLVIVKKKRPEVKEVEVEVRQSPSSFYGSRESTPSRSMESMFATSNSASELQKKKKKLKKIPAEKKSTTEKLDIALNIEMGDNRIDTEEEDMIVLPDLNVGLLVNEEAKKKKQIDPSQIRTTKKTNFVMQGIQRVGRKRRRRPAQVQESEAISAIEIPEEIRVYEFAEKINKPVSEVIKELFSLGVMFTKNDFLDKDSIEILAETFGINVTTVNDQEAFDYVKAYDDEGEASDQILVERAPVITIMGHVDHGKTSLLDYIRSAKVAAGEAGGITQHVGAYMVEKNGRNITFIDTPGHEAFTEMRSRGAKVTDIVIVVVAADDGVKPQTKEAIEHAKAANVPIIIAVNKMDKEAANPDLVKAQLAELGITPVDWGGEHEFVPVSAKTGMGIEDLLETILLQADVLELKADPSREVKATVIESSLEKGRGPVATVVVEDGTMRVGDIVVAGVAFGKVKALLDDLGRSVKEALPGEPVVVLGLSEVPGAGDTLISVKTDKIAREYAKKKAEYLRQKELSKTTKVSLDDLSAMIAEGALKTLPVIIKADVQGSLEAIKGSLEKIRNSETKVNIVSAGIGGITESDVAIASASSDCIILGFHVRPTGVVKEKAKSAGVEIKTYNIIYDLIDDVTNIVTGLMAPVIREENIGQAMVREVFPVPKLGHIAGCIVTDGTINRGVKIRVIRDGVIIYEGSVSSLKRFKEDVKEVGKGYECGVGITGYTDIKVGDYIESFKEVEEKAKL